MKGSPWGVDRPVLAAALNENNIRNISVVKFDPSAPVAFISKLLRVEEFFEEGITKHILSTLSVLQDVIWIIGLILPTGALHRSALHLDSTGRRVLSRLLAEGVLRSRWNVVLSP